MHNLPSYGRWQKQFAGRDVAIIGVHTPETADERVPANVARHVRQDGITYPVLLDANYANWNRWRQQFWPAIYLIDKRGHIRYRWDGELEYGGADGAATMARLINRLLDEPAPGSPRR